MKTLVKQCGVWKDSSDSWVICKTRSRLLETLENEHGLTIRIRD